MESKKITKDSHKNEADIQSKPPANSFLNPVPSLSQDRSPSIFQESSNINPLIISIKSSEFNLKFVESWSDEDIYEGSMKDGLFHGFGRIIKNNNIFYEGYFYKGKFEGSGCLNLENSVKYSGEFSNNTFYGIGILTLATGESYITELQSHGNMKCKKIETSFIIN